MHIYVITNLTNRKQYVGQTIQNPKDRWHRHTSVNNSNTVIGRAIKKYGKENFSFEVVDKANSTEELNIKEREWIAKLGTYENGYNSSKGDKNMPMEESTKSKISTKLTGIKRPYFNKPVVEVTSGIEFNSQTEAFNHFKLGRNVVYDSIKRGRATKSGLIFRFKEI